MSVVAVYTLTEMCETEETFYTKLDSVLDQRPSLVALIVQGHLVLSLSLRVLAMICVPKALVPEMTTALSS